MLSERQLEQSIKPIILKNHKKYEEKLNPENVSLQLVKRMDASLIKISIKSEDEVLRISKIAIKSSKQIKSLEVDCVM